MTATSSSLLKSVSGLYLIWVRSPGRSPGRDSPAAQACGPELSGLSVTAHCYSDSTSQLSQARRYLLFTALYSARRTAAVTVKHEETVRRYNWRVTSLRKNLQNRASSTGASYSRHTINWRNAKGKTGIVALTAGLVCGLAAIQM